MLVPCLECRKKISDKAQSCPHCGFSLVNVDQREYQQKMEESYQRNREIGRRNNRVHLFWLGIFTLVILGAVVWPHFFH